MDTSTNYCFEPVSPRRASQPSVPSAYSLPPPPTHLATPHNAVSNDPDQVMSPPPTPSLSPSVTMTNSPFKRKFSTDAYSYSAATANTTTTSSSAPSSKLIFDNPIDRRSSACSAMSVDDYQHHPYWSSMHMQKQRSMSFSERMPSRRQPSKQNKHVCNYPHCGWSFKRYEHLKRHMLVHTGERPHACPYPGCGKRFSRSDNFHAHYRTHTKKALEQQRRDSAQPLPPPPPAPTQQPYPHSFQHDSGFHTRPPLMQLPEQDKYSAFRPRSDYSRSSFSNGDNLPYMPPPPTLPPASDRERQYSLPTTHDVCDSSSSSSAGPSSSDDEKQHICTHPDCQRRFKRLEHLKRHMRIHTLERPFQCTYAGCQKTFSRSDNLTQHLKTHERRESRYHPRLMHEERRPSYHDQYPSEFNDYMRTPPPPYPPSSSAAAAAAAAAANQGYHHPLSTSPPRTNGPGPAAAAPTSSSSSMHMLGWHPGDAASSVGC